MKPQRLAFVGLVLLAAGGFGWLAFHAAELVPNQDSRAAVQQSSGAVDESLALQPSAVDERREVAHDDAIVAAPGGKLVHGFVLDVDGARCADVAIAQHVGAKDTLVARSDAEGKFAATLAKLDGTLTTGDGPWVCVAPFTLSPTRGDQEHRLVVARAMSLGGRVVDERGAGVARATVGVRLTTERAATLPATTDAPANVLGSAITDASGAFELRRFAGVAGTRLQASREPLMPCGEPLPLDGAPVLLVLHDPSNAKLVHGFVVDRADRPLERVKVALGGNATQTESDGAFRIAVAERGWPLDPDAPLEFELFGFQPRQIEHFGRVVLDATGPLPSQRVVLLDPDLHVSGFVLDARGRPVSRGRVRVRDRGSSRLDANLSDDGSFDVRGLAEGECVLECELSQPLLCFASPPVRAGARDVILRVPADALVPRVVGRVVAPDGNCVPAALVGVVLKQSPQTERYYSYDVVAARGAVTCDAVGGFELQDVPRADAVLVVAHKSIVSTSIDVAKLDLTREVKLVVRRKSSLVFDGLPATTSYVTISLLDEAGRTPRLEKRDGSTCDGGACQLFLSGGRSEALTIAEGRYALTVGRAASPVFQRDIELVGGQQLVVRP